MSNIKKVWVMAENSTALGQLCAGGHQLGAQVSALIYGTREEAEQAIRLGADHIYWLGDAQEARRLEDYTETIAALLQKECPHLVMIQACKRGRLMAGRLAAGIGTSVLVDANALTSEEDSVKAVHMVYGGAAFRTEKALTTTTIATVNMDVFTAVPEDASRQAEITSIDFVEPAIRIKVLEKKPKARVEVDLSTAKRVVGVGRGIANEEDIRMAQELAEIMGAEVGCTRPIAEGVNWLPRERYIGVSGVMLKPELYLAMGISGQVQHMVGIDRAKVIVSVNQDKTAPIFKQSDYGIIGDLYKVLPKLIEKFKAL